MSRANAVTYLWSVQSGETFLMTCRPFPLERVRFKWCEREQQRIAPDRHWFLSLVLSSIARVLNDCLGECKNYIQILNCLQQFLSKTCQHLIYILYYTNFIVQTSTLQCSKSPNMNEYT